MEVNNSFTTNYCCNQLLKRQSSVAKNLITCGLGQNSCTVSCAHYCNDPPFKICWVSEIHL